MNTICCLNPDCLHPNLDSFKFCQKCGSKLVLRERYVPRSILGQGGFSRTFLAIDKNKPSQPFCVIKQFLPQAQGIDTIEKASQLFAQEAERLEELGKHPQIPEFIAYFTADNRQYLVTEFVNGETLQTELDKNGAFSEKQIRLLLLELLIILQFVHSKQVIHRDIKPDNIMRRNSDKKLFLVDFGAAKVVQQKQLTVTGTIIGSAQYCAPEQSLGKPKFISDLYSLGVTCLHLLTQVSPSDLYDVMEGEWVWRDYLNGNVVSDELGKILEKLASPIPKHRYQSAEEVINALNPFRKLEPLLAAGNWKAADEETRRVMLAVAKRGSQDSLDVNSINNFPCEDLGTIDHLWVKYSNGRFGFSVQKRIYQSLGGTKEYNEEIWQKFGKEIGWRKGGEWLDYEDIWKLNTPLACLPCRCGRSLHSKMVEVGTWWAHYCEPEVTTEWVDDIDWYAWSILLASKLVECNI